MGLFVNTNVASLQSIRALSVNQPQLSVSYERLSSGYRINRAADDAAGLQISERLTSQISGLDQAVRNANDGISLVQTADGALAESVNILQRMRVLAVQAENGINSNADKQALQSEVAALKDELDRIATTTEFAGESLLNGTYSSSFLVGANENQTIDIGLTSENGLGTVGIGVDGLDVNESESPETLDIPINGGVPFTSADTFASTGNVGEVTGLLVSQDGVNFFEVPPFLVDGVLPASDVFNFTFAIGLSGALAPFDANTAFSIASPTTLSLNVANVPSLTFATSPGANATEISNLTGLSPAQLGSGNSFTFADNLQIIDGAISRINTVRAELGALQNRFQSTIRNLSNIHENVSSARRQIRDTDYAMETASLSKHQIIQQASTAVLSQANTRPQLAISLLS